MRKTRALYLSKNTIVRSWLASYLLLLLFVSFFAAIAYSKAISYAMEEVEHVYEQELRRVAASADRSLLEMRRIGQELSIDPDVNSLINAAEVSADERMSFYSLRKRLNSYTVTNQNITDVAIGLRRLDYVVSNRATYSLDLYADTIGGGDAMRAAIGGGADGFYVCRTLEDSPTVGYLMNLPLEANSSRTAYVQAKLSCDVLSSLLGGDSGRMLTLSVGEDTLTLGDLNLREAPQESCTRLTCPSEFSGVSYALTVDNRTFQRNIAAVNLGTTVCVLLCIGACSFMLVFFIRRNYSPVGQLLHAVDMSFDRLPQNYRNEFDFIQQKLALIQDKNEKMELTIDQTARFRREAAVTQLLMGDISPEKAGEAVELFPGQEPGFAAAAVSFLDWRQLFHTENAASSDNLGLLKYIVSNMMHDFDGDTLKSYGTTIGGMYVTLFCGSPEAVRSALCRIEDYPSILSSVFGAEVQIGMSACVPDAGSIPELYAQAREAAEFCRVFDKPFQRFRTGCTSGLNHAQFAAEIMRANKNFRSALAQGDFSGASQWLQELMGLCFDQQQSVQDVQASMRVLSTIFCGGLAEYRSRYHAENLDVGAIAEELASYATANQLNQALLERLDALKALAIARNSEEKTQLREELIAYIEKNCTRYDLTVSSMSAYFNMTVSSLSQKFRKITGMGVLEYITQAKIRKAKELLETRQYTISQVAELVGYNDASTFIRNFKKVEGISPGRYLQGLEKDPGEPQA